MENTNNGNVGYNTIYFHEDHLGSPLVSSNPNGAIRWRESYSPFGEGLIDPSDNYDQPGFTGHIKDRATGLNYMQARYYDPVMGRFLSHDPVQFSVERPLMFNRYGYAFNNPANLVDPDGRVPVWVAAGGGSAGKNFVKKLVKNRGNVRKTIKESGEQIYTVIAPDSSALDRGIAVAEIISPITPSDVKDAGKAIEAVGARLGGRKGNLQTRSQNEAIGDRLEEAGYRRTGGGQNMPEQYVANPNGSRSGGRYGDNDFIDPDKNEVVVQTVDTNSSGVITPRETNAAIDIMERTGKPVVCVAKSSCGN